LKSADDCGKIGKLVGKFYWESFRSYQRSWMAHIVGLVWVICITDNILQSEIYRKIDGNNLRGGNAGAFPPIYSCPMWCFWEHRTMFLQLIYGEQKEKKMVKRWVKEYGGCSLFCFYWEAVQQLIRTQPKAPVSSNGTGQRVKALPAKR